MKPSWTTLNAYVDGELDPAAAAEVARAVAEDREAARQVAALARLKAAAADAMANSPGDVPSLRIGHPGPSGWRRFRPVAVGVAVGVAVAAMLVVVVAGGAWDSAFQPDPARAWLERVEGRHARWIADDAGPTPIAGPAPAFVAAAGGAIPDLGPMRLEVAHAAVSAPGGQRVLHVGYVGVNGCRLSLWIGPAPAELDARLAEHREAGAHVVSWRVGDTAYAAIARDMDASRLRAIAGHLERLSRGNGATRLAGLATDGDAAPCLG